MANNQVFKIKRNDTLPALKLSIMTTDRLGSKSGYDLTEVTGATFTMIEDKCKSIKVYSQSAEITCYSGGTLQYNWSNGDTDTSGTYMGEFELNFSDGTRMSIPSIGGVRIEIIDDLNSFN
jgi:hypothetical protein